MPALAQRQEALKRFAKLKTLVRTKGKRSNEAAVTSAVESLGGKLRKDLGIRVLQFDIRSGSRFRSWHVKLLDGQAKCGKGGADRPDVCFRMSMKDALDIASARVAPAQVYLEGRMVVQGDCRLARRVYVQLAARGETEIR